jgi:hypothetical protein
VTRKKTLVAVVPFTRETMSLNNALTQRVTRAKLGVWNEAMFRLQLSKTRRRIYADVAIETLSAERAKALQYRLSMGALHKAMSDVR